MVLFVLYVPAGQGVHDVLCDPVDIFPEPQGVQELPFNRVPGPQITLSQDVLLPFGRFPAPQGLHIPFVPACPAGQGIH